MLECLFISDLIMFQFLEWFFCTFELNKTTFLKVFYLFSFIQIFLKKYYFLWVRNPLHAFGGHRND